MAHENVRIPTSPDCPNFCVCPRSTSEFCYIDHSNDVLRVVRTSDGAVQRTYTLSSGVNQIISLEYTGPRNLSLNFSDLGAELPFFTLEHISSSKCAIKRWKLNGTTDKLNLQETIELSGSKYNCYSMSVEHYETSLDSATATGTGQLDLTSSSGIDVGDDILLGPSSDSTNLHALEYVTVTGVVGNTVYLDNSKPDNEYASGDPVTCYKYAYVFSDVGQNTESNKGSLYKVGLNSDSTVSGIGNSGIYSGVRASSWSRAYEAVGFVKDTNLLYLSIETYQIQKSQALTNISDDDVTILPIYDVVFDDTAIYRLQRATTLADSNGDKATFNWSTYNYQLDSIAPYTKSIVLYTIPDSIVLSDDRVRLVAVVRDQFGVGLSSKVVQFYDDPDSGAFDPADGQATTNSNGIASLYYDTNYFNPVNTGDDFIDIAIKAKTDGGVAGITGHDNVWDRLELLWQRKFTMNFNGAIIQKPTLSGTWPSEGSDLYTQTALTQIEGMDNSFHIKCLSKFQYPGGDWVDSGAPTDDTKILKQIKDFESKSIFKQIDHQFDNILPVIQDKEQTNTLQLSQLYVSRHFSSGHKDNVDIEQFRFIEDAIPAFWSEKNPVNTDIWIRLRPFAFDLNQSTLVFKVKEISYAGDTGYIDVTSSCNITTFDAGGGLLGLDVLYDPSTDFHHNGVVYVSIEVYDNAPTPNIILTDYWFKIIPDYKAPYIINEFPSRGQEELPVDTNISFDILDMGVGVDISSLEFYVNNRYKVPTVSTISGGYRIFYDPPEDFDYGQTVELTVNVKDASDYHNQLHDMWRFYCENSPGPWIDRESFYPKNCVKGTYRKLTGISANVYGINGTGVDKNSILVRIGGKKRNVVITPIIYRID